MVDPRAAAVVAALLSLGAPVRTPSQRDAVIVRAKLIDYACSDAGVSCAILHGIAEAESGYRVRDERSRIPLMGCHPYTTDDWQQARCAVRAWRAALRRCRTVRRALARYQFGECVVPRSRRAARRATARYVRVVTAFAARVERGRRR